MDRNPEYLETEDLDADPLRQFGIWYEDAVGRGQAEADACCLATATADGSPSARFVLLKGWGPEGFLFFTNNASRKAAELEANPRAALSFYWQAVRRQVRAEGTVEKLSGPESERYFDSRPYESRLAAWASRQSSPLADRETLERSMAELRRRYPDERELPRPEFWGGYRLLPQAVEFWQSGPDRLHDRFLYRREGGGWKITRLYP